MGVSYWKIVGENIAKGLGEKTIRRLGIGGKFIGRAGAVVGIGFLAYELLKHYKENIEAEPAYQEMTILQAELEKWTSAISCLGREPFEETEYGSPEEGGAINALYKKKIYTGPGTRAADPKEAYALIGRAMNYIRQTENILGDEQFAEKKNALVSSLRQDSSYKSARPMTTGRFNISLPASSMTLDPLKMAILRESTTAAGRSKKPSVPMRPGRPSR